MSSHPTQLQYSEVAKDYADKVDCGWVVDGRVRGYVLKVEEVFNSHTLRRLSFTPYPGAQYVVDFYPNRNRKRGPKVVNPGRQESEAYFFDLGQPMGYSRSVRIKLTVPRTLVEYRIDAAIYNGIMYFDAVAKVTEL